MTTDAPRSLERPDGRRLAFAEWGASEGPALLFFHGGSDSRLEGKLFDALARALGIRVIAPDRPGFGASDPQPGRRFGDWPDEVFALADHLGLREFTVAGHSGGGPHALALAADPRARVRRVFAVASAAPWAAGGRGLGIPFRLVRRLSRSAPKMLRRFLQSHSDSVRDAPEKFLRDWGRMSAAEARMFEARPDLAALIVEEMREGYRQGIEAASAEGRLYYADWGLALEAIAVPVELVYGSEDVQAPVRWGSHLCDRIPGATLRVVEGEGHFSTLVASAETILEACRATHQTH